MATARRTLLRACRKLQGLDERILELSPLYWGEGTLGLSPRVRNRSVELVECERLASLSGLMSNVDLSSRLYVSAGRLPPSGVPEAQTQPGSTALGVGVLNARNVASSSSCRRSLARAGLLLSRATEANRSIEVTKQGRVLTVKGLPLNRFCDRCTLRLTGFSPVMDGTVETPVRRCQVCRGKVETYWRHPERKNLAPRSRRKIIQEDLSASRAQRGQVPVKRLSKAIRRKIWYTKCDAIFPTLFTVVGKTYNGILTATGQIPMGRDLRWEEHAKQTHVQLFWPDVDVRLDEEDNSVLMYHQLVDHETGEEISSIRMKRSWATLLGESAVGSPRNVLHRDRPWRKGVGPAKATAERRKRWDRYQRWREAVKVKRQALRNTERVASRKSARERHYLRALRRRESRHNRVMELEAATRYYVENLEELSITHSRLARDDSDNENDADRDSYFRTRGYTWDRGVWRRDDQA